MFLKLDKINSIRGVVNCEAGLSLESVIVYNTTFDFIHKQQMVFFFLIINNND